MQDLIKQLQEKAGLTEEQAEKSLQTIKEFIQSKLPPMMHGMVDSFMANNAGDDDDDILEPRESFTDKAGKVMHDTADKVEDFAEDAADKMGDWAEKAEHAAKDALSKLKNMMKDKDEKF